MEAFQTVPTKPLSGTSVIPVRYMHLKSRRVTPQSARVMRTRAGHDGFLDVLGIFARLVGLVTENTIVEPQLILRFFLC